MQPRCPCVAVPKRFLMTTLVIVGMQVILWQSISFTMYCFKWQDYYGYQRKQPFVFSHLVGLILSLMPGSLTTVSYGANKVFGLSILALSGLLEVAPLTIHFGIHGLASIQFLNGVAEGFITTSLYGVLADWIPVCERTTVLAIVICTTLVGGRCMFEAVHLEFVTSPVMFANVVLGIAWFVLWRLLFFDGPYHHKLITEEERSHITDGNTRVFVKKRVRRVPWRCILTSTPVHLVCLAIATGMYEQRLGKYNYLMYLGDFHRFPSLPSVLALAAVIVTCGVASDFLRDKALLSTSVARKMTASGGLMIHACAAMLLGLKESHWIENIAVTALGVFILGIDCNHLDLAPQHAAVLKGVSSTTLWVVVGALNVFIITETSSVMSHRIAHVVLPVCQMVAAMLFLLYGHGRRQEWDLPDSSHADTEVSVSEDVEASEPALDPRSEPGTSDSTERDWPQNRPLQHEA